jgi:hypothetical protein
LRSIQIPLAEGADGIAERNEAGPEARLVVRTVGLVADDLDYQVLPVLQAPTFGALHERVTVPLAAFVMVKVVVLFDVATTLYASIAVAATTTVLGSFASTIDGSATEPVHSQLR